MIVNRQPFDYGLFCEEMDRRMPCQHGNARPRKKGVKPNGSVYYRLQCPDCGAALLPTQLKHAVIQEFEAKGFLVEEWDERARAVFDDLRWRHSEDIRKKYGWERGGWWNRYTAYLESAEWRAKRWLVLERDHFICQECKLAPATQVHHLTYQNAGSERLDELKSVCASCHTSIHTITPIL